MICFFRIEYHNPLHRQFQQQVWEDWILTQPEYMEAGGYSPGDFEAFAAPQSDMLEIGAVTTEGKAIALFQVMAHGDRRYEFHMITPRQNDGAALQMALLRLREDLFLKLQAHLVTTILPVSGARHRAARWIAKRLGMTQAGDQWQLDVWDWMQITARHYVGEIRNGQQEQTTPF